MVYETRWANKHKSVISLEFDGIWMLENMMRAERDLQNMMSEVGHTVSIIFHMIELRPIPMEMLSHFRSLIEMDYPNRDRVIVVVPEQYLDGMSDLVGRIFGGQIPHYVQVTSRFDQANAMLKT
jgi:hypothetical protein